MNSVQQLTSVSVRDCMMTSRGWYQPKFRPMVQTCFAALLVSPQTSPSPIPSAVSPSLPVSTFPFLTLIKWCEGCVTEKTEAIWQDILHPFFFLASGYHLPNKAHLYDVWDPDLPIIPFLLCFKLYLNSSIFLLAYKHDTSCLSQKSPTLASDSSSLKNSVYETIRLLQDTMGENIITLDATRIFWLGQPKHNTCKNKQIGLCLNWKILCSKDTFNLE